MNRFSQDTSRPGDFTGPLVCGVDEAGRGPLAGPVVSAAVILSDDLDLKGIDDSKKLSPQARDKIKKRIETSNSIWAVGIIEPEIIDRINILQAALLSMKRAIENLETAPDLVLVDGKFEIPGLGFSQKAIVGGDASEISIAAASIIAKTHRDEIMLEMEKIYPGYNFSKNKGYPTKEHIACLKRLGPSPIHRMSFRPVCDFIKSE